MCVLERERLLAAWYPMCILYLCSILCEALYGWVFSTGGICQIGLAIITEDYKSDGSSQGTILYIAWLTADQLCHVRPTHWVGRALRDSSSLENLQAAADWLAGESWTSEITFSWGSGACFGSRYRAFSLLAVVLVCSLAALYGFSFKLPLVCFNWRPSRG